MYEYLKGQITAITPVYIVLEVNGIGYQIQSPHPFLYEQNQEVLLYVHQIVREDAHLLFGFRDLSEKELFLRLISVSGIGPKSALAILAGNDPLGLQEAIEREDVTYLTRFPGVGKKTARQMILDLKGKLIDITPTLFTPEEKTKQPQHLTDALEALKALGYSAKDVNNIKESLAKENLKTEAYISKGLKLLMKK